VAGEGVKALSRVAKENPRKVKLRRGSGGSRSKPPRFTTDSREEQGPVGGRRLLVPTPQKWWQEAGVNDMRATAGDEPVRLLARENP